jgi:hypothetical protein
MKQIITNSQASKVQILADTFLNPNTQNLLAFKLLFGLPLNSEEIRAALRSQEPNPFKTWFLELIFCYIRYLCNQDTIVLQQILLEQKRQQEEFALLTELDELKSEAQAKLILRNIDLLTVASLYKELEAAKETCYQVLQLTKANELEFWRKLIRDDEVFSKVLLALEAKYRLLREGQELVAKIEQQLATTNLPAEKRQRMEDQVQAYKDHVRLSSPENIQKYIPHHLLSDPDKIPVIVQKGAATEEIAITSLREKKSENKQTITGTQKESQIGFFNYLPINQNQTSNGFNRLFTKLDFLYNQHFEHHPQLPLPNSDKIEKLLSYLKQLEREPNNRNLETAIYHLVQNLINLSHNPKFTKIMTCLKEWHDQYAPKKSDPLEKCIEPFNDEENKDQIPQHQENQQPESEKFAENVIKTFLPDPEKNSYLTLIAILEREVHNLGEEAKNLNHIAILASQAQTATTQAEFDQCNDQIIDELNFIIENFPSLPILSEIYSAISNLPLIKIDNLSQLEEDINGLTPGGFKF